MENDTAEIREALEMLMSEMRSLKEENAMLKESIRGTPKLRIEKPTVYTGERDALKIENWLYSVREYILAYNLKGLEAVRVAASFTDGHAKLYWRNIKEKLDGPLDVDTFLNIISERFYPSDSIQVLRDKLDRLKQVKSVAEYSRRFEEVLLQIPSKLFHDADMKDKFVRGLKREVKKMVMIHDPPTLADAIKVATRIDTVIYNTSDGIPLARSYGNNQRFGNPGKSDRMEVDHVESRKGSLCYNCKKQGHFSRDCPEPASAETLAARQRSGKGQQRQ
jgi:hypothetical protein